MSSYFEPNNPKKTPDEFVSFMDHVSRYVLRYQTPIIAFIVVVALAVVGTLVFKNRKEALIKELNQKVYQAEKSEDPVKSLEALKTDHEKDHGGYAINLALFRKHREAKDLDKARQELLIAQEGAPDFIKPLLEYSYAQILWQQGKAEEALKALGDGQNSGVVGNNDKYLKAVILQSTGKVDEAKKIFQEVIQDKERDPFAAQQARASLWSLMAEGR